MRHAQRRQELGRVLYEILNGCNESEPLGQRS
jgi:hypothetical protein